MVYLLFEPIEIILRMKTYNSKSLEETQKIAEELGVSLTKGSIITLYGDLGSGKTTFVQGLAKGLGIDRRLNSPTFIIVRSYKLKTTAKNLKSFYHIDLYRIQNEKEIEGLGLKEIMSDPQNIVAIEWAEKLGTLLPEKRTDIKLEYVDENRRSMSIYDYTPGV